jgi:outer membrane translocation and assembly module TamA
VVGRYSYDFTQLFDTKIAVDDRLLIDRLFPQVHLSSLFGSVLRDSRNDVLDPERGAVLGADLELALRALSSEVGFAKSFVQAFAYRRLPGGQPFVLAAGARLGAARGFERRIPRLDGAGQPVIGPDGQQIVDVVADLPASERFFAGGDTTVRGFSLDRLGSDATLDADGFPSGGNGLVVLNLELRTPHVKGVGLVGFVDAGNVFARASDLTVSDMRTTAGFGFRYRSPLGPLRFDVGFKLDRRDIVRGSQRRVYHLSLGQAF